MAPNGWRDDYPLEDQLYDNPEKFGFYQAVRILELLFSGKIPVGEDSDPQKETIRFKSHVDLVFPPSEIRQIESKSKEKKPDEMLVSIMGLAGYQSPLPHPWIELIIERSRKKDTALKDFLDIFNHRLISLLYRVRKLSRVGFVYESPEKSHFTRYLYALMGLSGKKLKNRMEIKDRAFLYYTGLISQKPHSMTGLEAILSHYFKVPCKGIQMKGAWLCVEDDQITKIGIYGKNNALGHTMLVGKRVWNQQSKIEIILGPMNYDKFTDFLPTGSAWVPLCQLLKFYLSPELEFDIKLILKSSQIPRSKLEGAKAPRLGWTSWLSAKQKPEKPGIIKLKPESIGSGFIRESKNEP